MFFTYRTLKLIQIYKTDRSKLSASQDNKVINTNPAPLNKDNRESVDDNSCNSNKCNKIPDQELSSTIANDNSKYPSRINKSY